jgi:twinkle protein
MELEEMNALRDYGIHGIDETKGGQVKTTCPQCSSTRKNNPNEKCLSVNVTDKTWYCHHCNWSGGVQKTRYTQQWKEIPKPKPVNFKAGAQADAMYGYFASRGIDKTTIDSEKITLVPAYNKNWIAFPYYIDGDVVNVKYRALESKEFRQIKDGFKSFYRLDSIKDSKYVIITEGEIDALSFVQAGIKSVISVPEGGINPEAKNIQAKMTFIDNTINHFDHITEIYLALDNDAVGRRLCDELARRLGRERCYLVKMPDGCKDANDALKSGGAESLVKAVSFAQPYPIDGVKIANEYTDSLLDLYERGFIEGAKTHEFPTLDRYFSWHSGQLTVVTGVPSFGKSNFVDHVSILLAQHEGWKTAVFSPENPTPEVWLIRLAEIINKKSFSSGTYSRITQDELKKSIDWISKNLFFILPDSDTFALEDILATAQLLLRRFGINLLIIDPWNNLEMNMAKGETENLYVGRTLAKIRMFAAKTGIHVVLIAHPRKMANIDEFGNYEIPTPYSISGSSNFYNIPHNILIVHREFDSDGKSLARVIIAKVKNKYIGEVNKRGVYFTYDTNSQRFKEMTDYTAF